MISVGVNQPGIGCGAAVAQNSAMFSISSDGCDNPVGPDLPDSTVKMVSDVNVTKHVRNDCY